MITELTIVNSLNSDYCDPVTYRWWLYFKNDVKSKFPHARIIEPRQCEMQFNEVGFILL